MTFTLGDNRYGKAAVRLVKVRRGAERHDLLDLTVEVSLTGDFDDAYRRGDNREVLPTDTMKNTVYALARRHDFADVEDLALLLTEHFLAAHPPLETATVEIAQRRWPRIEVDGRPHAHAFAAPGSERRTAAVTRRRSGVEITAGISHLQVLKTTGSGFAGFPRDAYTTLAETDDRLLATTVDARWRYREPEAGFGAAWDEVRRLLLETFAGHLSRSVQHTLWAMGEAVLAARPEIEEIHLTLPNQHHLLVDLSPFGLDNPNQIFVATDAPYGVIEGTVRRG